MNSSTFVRFDAIWDFLPPRSSCAEWGEDRSVFDQVMAQDRRYFTENPDAGRYVRDYVRGEAYPGDSGLPWCVRVQVRQLAPGLRIRHFLSQWDDPTVWAVNPEHDYLVLDEDLG